MELFWRWSNRISKTIHFLPCDEKSCTCVFCESDRSIRWSHQRAAKPRTFNTKRRQEKTKKKLLIYMLPAVSTIPIHANTKSEKHQHFASPLAKLAHRHPSLCFERLNVKVFLQNVPILLRVLKRWSMIFSSYFDVHDVLDVKEERLCLKHVRKTV